MAGKPTYEALEQRVKALETEITERDREKEALRKACEEVEYRMGGRAAKLIAANQKLKQEIEERAETGQALIDYQHLLQTVIDTIEGEVFVKDTHGKYLFANNAFGNDFGVDPTDLIGKDDFFVFPPETAEILQKNDRRIMAGKKAVNVEESTILRGKHVTYLTNKVPLIDDDGNVFGICGVGFDITRQKKLEKALKDAHLDLERQVKERTAQLSETVDHLQNAYLKIEALKKQLEADRTYLREEIKLEHDYENIIGDSDVLKYVLFRAEQIAPTDTTVLILGETGTGKELIARAIHNASPRRKRPLIKVDCASLPANLIESELFGHEKGAFTGAVEKRIGRFELADGATIFLDEIGELTLELQSKLLRVLQDGEFERLGSSQTLRTDIRVIAATNRKLEEDVRQKHFRMDLWYRLSVFTISIPPLRERSEDIGSLVNFMIKNFEKKLGKRIRSVPSHIFTKLQNYLWPGNVRELENVIERAVINTQGETLQLEDVLDAYRPGDAESPDLAVKSLAEIEQEQILLALRKTNWKIHGEDGAAALLDINPSTLRGRMRKQKIRRPPYETSYDRRRTTDERRRTTDDR
jgi:chemotaxis protein methyltransferase CheR